MYTVVVHCTTMETPTSDRQTSVIINSIQVFYVVHCTTSTSINTHFTVLVVVYKVQHSILHTMKHLKICCDHYYRNGWWMYTKCTIVHWKCLIRKRDKIFCLVFMISRKRWPCLHASTGREKKKMLQTNYVRCQMIQIWHSQNTVVSYLIIFYLQSKL